MRTGTQDLSYENSLSNSNAEFCWEFKKQNKKIIYIYIYIHTDIYIYYFTYNIYIYIKCKKLDNFLKISSDVLLVS